MDHNAQLAGVELEDVVLHRLSLLDRSRTTRGMLTCAAARPEPAALLARCAAAGWRRAAAVLP